MKTSKKSSLLSKITFTLTLTLCGTKPLHHLEIDWQSDARQGVHALHVENGEALPDKHQTISKGDGREGVKILIRRVIEHKLKSSDRVCVSVNSLAIADLNF